MFPSRKLIMKTISISFVLALILTTLTSTLLYRTNAGDFILNSNNQVVFVEKPLEYYFGMDYRKQLTCDVICEYSKGYPLETNDFEHNEPIIENILLNFLFYFVILNILSVLIFLIKRRFKI